MATRKAAPAPARADLGPEQMRDGLRKLDRREHDIRAFDVNAIADHNDQSADALCIRYNDTIARVFGEDSHEYKQYFLYSFEIHDGPLVMSPWTGDMGPDVREIREDYARGIQQALTNFANIGTLFNENLEDFAEDPRARVSRAFGELDIHPAIADATERLIQGGHYANAVEDACKALDALVQKRSGRGDLTGTPLMQTVFSANAPILKVADIGTPTGKDEQLGMMYLFSGAMLGLRNPRAHSLAPDDPERAIEYIAFLSLLAKIADSATK